MAKRDGDCPEGPAKVNLDLGIPKRTDVINSFKDGGGSVAAVLPIHYPRSLLRAFDILPVEVWGPPGVDAAHGAGHLQPYVCSIVRNALSFLQAGGLDVVDYLIVPHACDSLQGLASILIDFIQPRQTILPLYLPRGQRESDQAFLADECRSLYHRLTEATGHGPSEAGLLASIEREEAADHLLSELHQRRRRLPLGNLAFYRLIRSREYLPAETFIELVQGALSHVTDRGQDDNGVSLLLSGIVPEPMDLLDTIESMGGKVVADDLACCSRRLYPAGESGDPFRRMAERILGAPPDPTRGSPIQDRLQHLLRLTEVSNARGVVFYDVKCCEPELFDLPQLRQELQRAGIPSTAIEVDLNDPLPHQTLTRLEAFLEMIR